MAENDTHVRHGTWLNPNFVWPESGRQDLIISSMAFGFILGFGILTGRNAWKQTSNMKNPWRSIFAWMVWGEIIVDQIMALIVWLLLVGYLYPNLFVWTGLLVVWTFQIQFIFQILCNRAAMVEMNRKRSFRIKWSVAAIVVLINISVFCIWIPARMQVSERYIRINNIWDRITKVLFLVIDLALNIYFVFIVRANLVKNGLKKYDKLVKYNTKLIVLSILLDVALVALMSLKNGLVYGQFQPVCYLIKLNIELSLAKLIAKIAREKNIGYYGRAHDAEAPKDQHCCSHTRTQTVRSTICPENPQDAELSDSDILVTKTHDVVVSERQDHDLEVSTPHPAYGVSRNESDEYPLTNVGSSVRWDEMRSSQRGGTYSVQVHTLN